MPSSNKGNKALTNPIGLITSDEAIFAGGFGSGLGNDGYYLRTNHAYWTMSPFYANSSAAYVFYVYSSGGVNGSGTLAHYGIRPVINLRSDVTLSGSGLSSDPYRVS